MAEFLTTNGTSYNIENIIIDAKSKLILVSPYLQISKTFYERLKDASNKNVSIKIIYGKDELKPNERNSREMGVLIDRNTDKDLFDKAVAETLSIIQSAEQTALRKTDRPIFVDKKQANNKQTNYRKIIRGYCIRCETRIDYNPTRPYCGDCFSIWAQFENPDYQENVCHRCGEYEMTSMNKPQCYYCYTEHQQELRRTM